MLTISVAEAGALFLPLQVCNAPAGIVLTRPPLLQLFAAVTITVTVQEPSAGIEPPVSVTLEPPMGAVTLPPQVVLALPETTTPLGKLSVNGALSFAATPLGLFRVMVRRELAPMLTVEGLKDLLTVGGTIGIAVIVNVAIAGARLLPLLVCNAPMASVFR